MEQFCINNIALKIIRMAVHDSKHASKIDTRLDILGFLDSDWFSTICQCAGIARDDELKKMMADNVNSRNTRKTEVPLSIQEPRQVVQSAI